MRLVAVTDRRLSIRPLEEQVSAICDAGADVVALREKDLSEEGYESLLNRIRDICDKAGTEVWVNGFTKVAERTGCDAVWIPYPSFGEEGRPRAEKTIVSVHSYGEAVEASRLGADAVVFGNVYETCCKPGLPGKGTEVLRRIVGDVDAEVYAIGGINADNIAEVRGCGVDGVCVRSLLMEAGDPAAVTASLRERRRRTNFPAGCDPGPQSIWRSPVIRSSASCFSGPMPRQVTDPGSTSVLPASVTTAFGRPCLSAMALNSKSSLSPLTLRTAIF